MCDINPDWTDATEPDPPYIAISKSATFAKWVGEQIFGKEIAERAFADPVSDIGRVELIPPKPHSRVVFRKVYKGPGYPIDPRNEAARALEKGMNLIPQVPYAVDYRPLRDYLVEAIN